MAKRGCDGQVLGGRVRKSSQDTLFGLDFKVLTHCVIIGYAMTFRGRSGRKKCILFNAVVARGTKRTPKNAWLQKSRYF